MHKSRRIKITEINQHLICVLCSGYLIDATTIIECLHSYCRTCIVKYLESNKYCPICDVQVHKTKPLLNIRSDQTLQDIVYKLVPGLFQNEMCRRRDFYAKHPEQKPSGAEERGEVTQVSHIYTADESISLSLEYYNNNISYDTDNNAANEPVKTQAHPNRRFLRCPAAVSVSHLQKLIRAKYGLSAEHRVDILYKNDRLSEDFSLMDIAYIYLWRRKGPLHLTYRIFEVAKRIKLNDGLDEKHDIKTEKIDSEEGEDTKNEWKEVQLQISENGIMSVTNIEETKLPETVTSNVVDVKPDLNQIKPEIPELSPIQKSENPPTELNNEPVKVEEKEKETIKLGKHKLQDASDPNEPSAKTLKPNSPPPPKTPSPTVKNVQQLSRNHPLKIHSQAKTPPVSKNNQPLNTLVQCQTKSINNNNATVKPSTVVQKDQTALPLTVQSKTPVQNETPKTTPQPTSSSSSSVTITAVISVTTSAIAIASTFANSSAQNAPKYTQAGQSNDNMRTTKSDDMSPKSLPISSSCSVVSINNCIQSSKVGIVPKKSPLKSPAPIVYKTLRDPPKAWNPQIPRQNLPKPSLYPPNNGASTSDSKRVEATVSTKPAKFFKMRNNVPRYLGNPASGVKPMYQVREGDSSKTASDPNKKQPEIIKKPVVENKINNNNEIKTTIKLESVSTETKPKIEIKKQSIVKIDPKTLRPITDKPSQDTPSCSDSPEMKINQSSVPIFNPLRTQKSQTSPKIDRRSPKYLDMPPKSPMDRSSPKVKNTLNSPLAKKDKLSINFTPSNPFIPNLTSPNLAPNQFLYPNYASYDPRVMNNLTAYHPFSMYYSHPRLTYPGLSSQNLPLSPNLMSSLNLEVNKNKRKNYEMAGMLQLSPNLEIKKPSTTVKRENLNEEKSNSSSSSDKTVEIKSTTKNNKSLKIEKLAEKKEATNNKNDNRTKTTNNENSKQKSEARPIEPAVVEKVDKKEEIVDNKNVSSKEKDKSKDCVQKKDDKDEKKKEPVETTKSSNLT